MANRSREPPGSATRSTFPHPCGRGPSADRVRAAPRAGAGPVFRRSRDSALGLRPFDLTEEANMAAKRGLRGRPSTTKARAVGAGARRGRVAIALAAATATCLLVVSPANADTGSVYFD